ncbi:sensor domain-containing phosphodiesterase [Bacillus luteolus]|uniref:Sensor domain-containing phosphodiesterase n=1 Tax=Litchfieldia luteola TaxID=682179 RepID=A0ABR9QEL4_9BACI|nr:bifunctional diguanylate cyclase/phosphodiesterase [Cytobacillus luteolus]MBE4906934.1 sensor domain-containing phosphodiesterase [Cytobacillus luteolus]MBP1943603.1 polar amino acid transport system substrate-binding protein [Cytobacillus luteolus]
MHYCIGDLKHNKGLSPFVDNLLKSISELISCHTIFISNNGEILKVHTPKQEEVLEKAILKYVNRFKEVANEYEPVPIILQTSLDQEFTFQEKVLVLRELGADINFVAIPIYLPNQQLFGAILVVGTHDFPFQPAHISMLQSFAQLITQTILCENRSLRDRLTGLYNRDYLLKNFKNYIAKHDAIAVLNFELDRFNLLNDTYGYELGDTLIRIISERVMTFVRDKGSCFRIGDDEFIVILSHLNIETTFQVVTKISEEIIKVISSPIRINNEDFIIKTGLGISLFPLHGTEIQTLLRKSNIALNLAKKSGTNYEIYHSEYGIQLSKKIKIENDLRNALDKNEFQMHYQSQFDLNTGKLIGLEALIRWKHLKEGFIPPSEFIPIAEESGLIVEIGNWIMSEVFKQAKAWLDQGLEPIQFSINISSKQFKDEGFINRVKSLLKETNLPPKVLNFEITETVLMENIKKALDVIEQLKEIGICIAIDDFGTGYSSLSYLRNLPVDRLKIDKCFIDEITKHHGDQVIVRAIIDLGKQLGMSIVAEGVELLEQHNYLREKGCIIGQGYFYHRPSPIEAIIDSKVKMILANNL